MVLLPEELSGTSLAAGVGRGLQEKVMRGVGVGAGGAVAGREVALCAASLTGQAGEGVLAFVKGAGAVGDADSSGGGVAEVGVVEVMLDIVDGAAEGAVGG